MYNECTYKDGKLDGLYRRWYENGQLRNEYTYKDNKRDGSYREWYETGQLREECTYKEGEILVQQKYEKQLYDLSKFCIDVNTHTKYSTNIKDEICCICLDNLEENVCKLSCNHVYHLNCIETYIDNKESKLNCCLCKQSIIII